MTRISFQGPWLRLATLAAIFVLVVMSLGLPASAQTQDEKVPNWGVGWADGLTVRHRLGEVWDLSLAAGPDDYLAKDEVRTWDPIFPAQMQGLVEVPRDLRDEHGWVRVQAGRLLASKRNLALVAFSAVTYEWIDHQERRLELDTLMGEYNTFELDRFTHHWVLSVGLRPSWQPTDFLTIETSFGLNFNWDSWDQSTRQTWAGLEGESLIVTAGHGRKFSDFGWSGLSSLQFIFWF